MLNKTPQNRPISTQNKKTKPNLNFGSRKYELAPLLFGKQDDIFLSSGRWVRGLSDELQLTSTKREKSNLPLKVSQYVAEGYKVLKHKENNKEALFIRGAGPCLSITMFDRLRKIGGITHFSHTHNIASLTTKMIEEFKKHGSIVEDLTAGIFGNNLKNATLLEPIRDVNLLEANKVLRQHNIKVIEQDVMGTIDKEHNIALNLNNGKILDFE